MLTRALSIILFLIVLGGSILSRFDAGGISDRFPDGHVGVNTAAYTGRIASNIERLGIVGARAGAPFAIVPTSPITIHHYDRHPFLYWHYYAACLRLFGATPRVLNWTAALGLIALSFGLAILGARSHAAVAGTAAATLVIGTPIMAHYGFMACTHLSVLMWASLAIVARPYALTKPSQPMTRLAKWVFYASLFMACMLDWWGYVLSIALIIDVICFEAVKRRNLWAILSPTAAAAAITFLSFAYTLDGFERAFKHLLSLGVESRTDSRVVGVLEIAWWERMLQFSVEGFGLCALAISLLGWIAVAYARDRASMRCLLICAMFAIGNHVILTRYAYTHPYWALFWVPSIVVSCTHCFGFALRRAESAFWLIAAIVLAASTWGIFSATQTLAAQLRSADVIPQALARDLINSVAKPEDMVVTNISTALISMELRPIFALGPIESGIDLEAVRKKYLQKPIDPPGRVFFILAHVDGYQLMKTHLLESSATQIESPFPDHVSIFRM